MTRAGKVTLCKTCHSAPAATAKYGRAGAARKAGQCSACWRQEGGAAPGKRGQGGKCGKLDLGRAISDLDEGLVGLDGETKLLAQVAKELLARGRAHVDAFTRRLADVRAATSRAAAQLREVAAEARRQTKAAGLLRREVGRTLGHVPDHLDTEGSRAGKAAEEARETA